MTRCTLRSLASFAFLGVGLWMSTWSMRSTVHGVPAPIAGWLFAVTGALGLLGVNVFAGGPLDRKRDEIYNSDPDEGP